MSALKPWDHNHGDDRFTPWNQDDIVLPREEVVAVAKEYTTEEWHHMAVELERRFLYLHYSIRRACYP